MLKALRRLFARNKERYRIPRRVQDVIPISRLWTDGTFLVGPNSFAKTWKFTDINYLVAGRAEQESKFLTYSDLLNSLDSGTSVRITINNRKTMKTLTEHFIKVHGFSRIYYMSGPFTSKDSPERLEGYKEAMAEAGLEIKPNYIYEGNYWLNRGKKAIDFFLNGTHTYPEAIICAHFFFVQ